MATRLTKLGWRGEDLARAWLEARGFRFVVSRFRTRHGEIDLVMQDGTVTVFVEVKTRQSRKFGRPEESVDDHKVERLRATAESYLAKHPEVENVRLDLIILEQRNDRWGVRHLSGIG